MLGKTKTDFFLELVQSVSTIHTEAHPYFLIPLLPQAAIAESEKVGSVIEQVRKLKQTVKLYLLVAEFIESILVLLKTGSHK